MVHDKIPDDRADAEATGTGADELVQAEGYVDGDAAVFAMIDRRIRTELGRCYSRLRVDHDDLAQSIHTKLLVALRAGRFEARSTLAGYVTAIVHHVAISRLRGLYRERAVFEPAVAEARDPRDNPYHAVVAIEERRLVHQVLFGLPAACRELWRQVFVEKLAYAQIAVDLGIPEGTVKSRMWHCRRRAMEALRRLLPHRD